MSKRDEVGLEFLNRQTIVYDIERGIPLDEVAYNTGMTKQEVELEYYKRKSGKSSFSRKTNHDPFG